MYRILFGIWCGLMLMMHGHSLYAGQFTPKEVKEDIVISYQWKKPGIFRKDGPLRLVLKIQNHNPHRVMIKFRVNYYWKTILSATSRQMEYCLRPGQSIRGKYRDLVFSAGHFNEEQILGDNFLWEISDLAISHHAKCKNSLIIKLKPDIHEIEQTTQN
jgi:hypothetical protein